VSSVSLWFKVWDPHDSRPARCRTETGQDQFSEFLCVHEIRPVTGGFRLALVYNLTLQKSKRTMLRLPLAEHRRRHLHQVIDGRKLTPRMSPSAAGTLDIGQLG
jgi:hypothetical protein